MIFLNINHIAIWCFVDLMHGLSKLLEILLSKFNMSLEPLWDPDIAKPLVQSIPMPEDVVSEIPFLTKVY